MAVRPILELGNPLLRKPSRPVKQDDLEQVRQLALDMYDTLQDFRSRMGYGRGIAAPQVGAPLRLVVLQHQGQPLALINPRLVDKGSDMFVVWDSCFSYPGIWFQVQRHWQVTVSYRDLNWQQRELTAEGALSELLQHELEHLDGRLAIDLADTKTFCTTNEYFARYWQGDRN